MSEMVEIPKAQYDEMMRGVGFLNKLWNDPEHGMAAKRLAKKLNPDARIAELDIVEPTVKAFDDKLGGLAGTLEAVTKRLDDRDQRDKEHTEETKLLGEIHDAVKKYGLTDDGRDKMVARMKEKGSMDAEAAASWVRDQLPKAEPVGHSGLLPSSMNLFGAGSVSDDASTQLLHQDPIKWQDQEILAALREFDSAA